MSAASAFGSNFNTVILYIKFCLEMRTILLTLVHHVTKTQGPSTAGGKGKESAMRLESSNALASSNAVAA
ncbi:hypothetical protein HDU97_005432 [Phlyctochytrium planicorne]|nr:hypothetical protein HDU97_005432 [Phlyctochytrium planicorne]